jgi:CHAT domain-containing protein
VAEQALHRGLDLGSLEDLYERLLAEPLSGIDRERHLVLVPDRFLLRIPFAALRDSGSGRFLVEERGISFATTFTEALRDPRERFQERRSRPWSVLVVGDPDFDRSVLPWLPRLPGALDEAEAVHALYGDASQLLLDDQATSDAVRRALAGRRMLHLAAHALPGAGDAGGALVLARSADGKTSGLTAGDELLGEMAHELDLVILSACSTLGTVPSRSGGLLGLARPFVEHGVSAVLGTLWPSDDETTADFMIAFHQGLKRSLAASDALRRAQLAALEGESEDECCAWAAFQLIGDVPGKLPSRSVH